jgi:uncharacterized Tic20 family protein
MARQHPMDREKQKTVKGYKKKRIPAFLTHRYCIMAVSGLIVIITALIIYDMVQMLFNTIDDANELEDMSDGLATILIGYGVAIEERETLMEFFGLYPQDFDDGQEAVDHLCHWYGLLYLILGLFMEIGVQLIKIPNRMINTIGLEGLIFSVNIVFMVLVVFLLLKHNVLLIDPVKNRHPEGVTEGAPIAETQDS